MKIICAWCGKVLKEDGEDQVSHVICPECYDQEALPFIESQRLAKEEKAFKPPPPEFDWLAFLEGQMRFSLAVGAVFFLIVLAAEGLHWISDGKAPSLIEWIAERPPVTDNTHFYHGHRRYDYPE